MTLKQALKASKLADVLHVATPRRCNTQQLPEIVQQAGATQDQPNTLKESNHAGCGRNTRRNSHATTHKKGLQQLPPTERPIVASRPISNVWRVLRNGKPFATMIGASQTHEEALKSARFHWPDCEVQKR